MGAVADALRAREAGLLDSDGLVERLARVRVRAPQVEPTDPAAAYAAAETWPLPGEDTWGEVVDALDTGRLTWAEYEALSARVEGPSA